MPDTKIIRATTKVNGVNLFYLDTQSDGPPMLLLHGRWGRAQTWAETMLRYGSRYRCIAPEQRGHGLSDKPVCRYTGEVMATDVYELIRKFGCEQVIVVGHSMGGRIASYFTYLFPAVVKALVILDETAAGPEKISDLDPEKIPSKDGFTDDWPIPYTTYAKAVKDITLRLPQPSNSRYFLESLVETEKGYDFLFSRYSMSAIDNYRQGWYHILPEITCPVLLVRAADSWCLSKEDADKMQGLIKDCTYFEVSGSDHMVYADNPDEFYPQFEQFLNMIS